MDYNHIGSFFTKVKQTLFKSEEVSQIVALTVGRHISYPVESKDIKTKGSIIYIKSSPVLRTEILIHKTGILADLAGLLPDKKFTDIR